MPRGEVSYEDMHKLIELVRRNTLLYDPTNKDYKDYTHIENAWNGIAEQMGRSDMSGYEWRKKWVNRRDTYVKKKRHIRNHRSPAAVERVKRWRFFEAMSFLDRFLESANDSADYNGTNEDDSSEGMLSGDEDADETTNVPSRLKSDSGKKRTRSPSPSKSTSKRKPADADNGNAVFSILPVSTSLTFNGSEEVQQGSSFVNPMADQIDLHLADHYHHSPQSTRVACPDYHLLFQAYAHRLERLPDRTQSFVQLQIAQLFFNAENPDLPPMPITPLPPSSILMSSSSSYSIPTASFRQPQRRQQDDFHEQQQGLQELSQDAGANSQSQGQMGLETENADLHRETYIKKELP